MLCLLAVSACAHDRGRYGHGPAPYDYAGDEWAGREGDDLFRPDPWLEETREGQAILANNLREVYHPEAVRDLNIRFRQFADTNRDMRLTDAEIRLALVRCAVHGWSW
jgi:hypothetical protein